MARPRLPRSTPVANPGSSTRLLDQIEPRATPPPPAVRYQRPLVLPYQRDALFHPARFCVIEACTKVGKTVGAIIWLHELAALAPESGRNFWWCAPSYTQARIAFTRLSRMLPKRSYESNKGDMTLTLRNGSIIWFKTTSNPDLLYGEDVYACVVDEFTRVPEGAWHAIRSTLTFTQGPVRMVGNVRGVRNWGFKLARKAEKGEDPAYHFARFSAWVAVEAGLLEREEIEQAQRDLPTAVFEELYEAKASDRARIFAGTPPLVPRREVPPNSRWVRSWDFAATEVKPGEDPDWTVGILMAQHSGTTFVVDVIREQVGSDAVVALFARTAMADNCDQVIEEEKGAAGKVLIASLRDALRRAGSPAAVHAAPTTGDKVTRAYMASAAWSHEPSKFAVVEADWTDIYLDEMESFPHGAHDDLVDGTSHGFNWLEGRAYLVGDFRMPGQPAEDAPDTRMPVDPPHRPSQIGSFRVPGQG